MTTPPTPHAHAHWARVFLPFAIGYYLSYLLRNGNAIIAPELTRELNLTAADLGLLTSAYFFTFGAFQVPLGILLDRFGPRRVEATLLLVAAAGSLVFALGNGIGELAIGRGLIGLGVSACLMAALKNFSQWFPTERHASMTGAIMAAGGLGAITASVPLEAILPFLGWRGIFLLLTAVIVAAAAFLFFTVPDHKDGVASATIAQQWQGVVHIFVSRDFWRFAPLMTLFSGGFMAVQALWIVPWFLNVDRLTREAAAQNMLAVGIAALASYFAIATFATKLIRRGVKPPALMSAVLALGWVFQILIVIGIGPALPLWILSTFCNPIITLSYTSLAIYFTPALFGRVSTALNLSAFVGAFSLQWGIGIVVDLFVAAHWSPAQAFRAAFALMLLLQLLALIWFIVEGRRRHAARSAAVKSLSPAP